MIIVATFFSHDYLLTSQPKLHDIFAFCHVQIENFFVSSSSNVATTIALAAKSFSKPPVIVLTCALWLASMTVGLGCVVFSMLLSHWISRYALVDQPHHGFRGPGLVSAFIMQYGSIRNVDATLRILRECLLVAAVLFLWGLDIRLLQTPNPPSPWVVHGLSITFFTGLFLIVVVS